MDGMTTLLIIVLAMVLFSFLLQRPLKKQAQAAAQMRDQLAEGSRVMLTGGLFGTITHVGAEQVIVELAPGVEVTCLKQAVAKQVMPEEEEFVFAEDDAEDDEVTPAVVTTEPSLGEQLSAPEGLVHPQDPDQTRPRTN